jgi:predicted short-subunit dehydrogenase-like oxidoreductase (DUF2520 family)
VAVVGAGNLASFLAPALAKAGYAIREVVARNAGRGSSSFSHARALARKVGARAVAVERASFDADLLWFCVPDRAIREAALAVAARAPFAAKYVFHSSGARLSGELEPLRRVGAAAASVHPLMTFVPGTNPSLDGVPFALEGDSRATTLAEQVVRDLGGESFLLSSKRKAAYHAWATMASPLLVAYLVTIEEAAREAGLKRENARKMSLPIVRQTLENYCSLGPGRSFSGPFIRGDAETVAQHLAFLKAQPVARAVYVALARSALALLPTKNRKRLRQLLAEPTA